MRYLALACDYDGTLASAGKVSDETVSALERLIKSGRKLILVTGRDLPSLLFAFPRCELFEWIVAENGCLLYHPATQERKRLGEPPPEKFLSELRRCKVEPLSQGEVIVATWTPHETIVLDVIRKLGLELQVIFNKGAVMVLPAGKNKATGLAAALAEMDLSPHNVAGIGDAENDHAFLGLCECAVAVANALPMLKEKADFITAEKNGAGVVELIDEIIADDLKNREVALSRHDLLFGTDANGNEIKVHPFGANLLLAGTSGAGKTTAATSFIERLVESGYQFCVIDPEGDYDGVEQTITLGSAEQPPSVEEGLELLRKRRENIIINMVAISFADRPLFFHKLMPRLQELRAQTGGPHWIIVDEAHHVLPASWEPTSLTLPGGLYGMLYISVAPQSLAPGALQNVDLVAALGETAGELMMQVGSALKQTPPTLGAVKLDRGEVLLWNKNSGAAPSKVKIVPTLRERRRHRRKYAEGDLGPERSFYFRGPKKKLNLKAQNLILFMQIADGVDDETWDHHLRQGDYSRWFRECIKDDALAAEATRIEGNKNIAPAESRKRIKAAITERFTLPV